MVSTAYANIEGKRLSIGFSGYGNNVTVNVQGLIYAA